MFNRSCILILIIMTVCCPVYSNDPEGEIVIEKKSDTGKAIASSTLDYWMPVYHSQVNEGLFRLVNYPYYPGGESFVRPGAIEVGDIYFVDDSTRKEKVVFSSRLLEAIDSLVNEMAEEKVEEQSKEDVEAPQVPQATDDKVEAKTEVKAQEVSHHMPAAGKKDITKFREYLESCSDLIFHWRQLNESPQFMLELLRAVKITETESGIFQAAPEIAVQIKRTIGSIAKLNANFDFTARVTMEAVLAGEYPRSWLSRQEKQLADMKNRVVVLKDLNDKASEALGLGPIDRSADVPTYGNPIYFEIIEAPDSYKVK